MNGTGGALDFDVILNDANFQRKLRALTSDTVQWSKTTVNELTTVENTFRRLGQLGAGYLAFNSLGSLPGQIAKVRGEFAQLEVAFETMLGSKSKADKLMAQTVEFAATTPFDLKGVATGAKQLLAYGFASDQVIGTLRKLGDVSAGLGLPLERLTYLYGTTKTQGRLFAQDLNQFVGSGIPLIKLLADQFGVAEDKVKGLVEEGKVGFPQVEKAINTLTSAGGMFAGMTEKASQEIAGLMSNFSDAIDQMYNRLGQSSEGTIKTIIKGGIEVVENYEDVIDVLKVLVTTYGAYKATVIATAAIQNASAAAGGIKAWFELARGIKTAKEAQIAFNLATSANPIGAVIALVAALATAYAVYGGELTEAEKAQERMNDAMEEMDKDLNKEIAHIGVLREQITGENLTRDEKAKKLKELIALNPELLNGISLENAATGQSTKAINEYIRAKKEQLRVSTIQAQIDANLNKISDITAGRSDDQFSINPLAKSGLMQAQAASGGTFDAAKEIEKDIKARKEAAVKGLQDLNRSYIEQVNNGIEQRRAGRRKELQTEKEDVKKTADYYDEQIEALKKKKKAESTSLSDTIKFNKQIEDLENKKRAITGEITKEQEKAQKEADKVGPMGSLSYWNNIAAKAQEIIDKTTDSKIIQDQSKIKFDAEQKAEDIRKQFAIKSFEEELEEKKKQYAYYNKWVEAYGVESANKQFAALISSNQDYISYLDAEIKKLEAAKETKPLNEKDSSNLVRLNTEKTEASGGKSVIDQYKEDLISARTEAANLTEYLGYLKHAQDALDSAVGTDSVLLQRRAVADATSEAQKQRKASLTEYLVSVSGSEEKRLEIQNHYADLRAQAEKDFTDDYGDEYKKVIESINVAEEEEHKEQTNRLNEKSKEYKALANVILMTGKEGIQERLKVEEAYLATQLKMFGAGSNEYKKQVLVVRALNKELADGFNSNFAQWGQSVGVLANVLEEIPGALGDIGSALTGLTAGFGNLSSAMVESSEKGK